jgi:hypothetical protein
MFKASLTLHKSPKGKLTVLELSEDAEKCLKAYQTCKEPGEIQYIRAGRIDKQKKIAEPEPKKKAAKKVAAPVE